MTIQCPKCKWTQVFIIQFTSMESSKTYKWHTDFFDPIILEEDGFFWDWIDHVAKDGSTTDEVAQCGQCGHKGDLSDFGFGET